MDRQEVFLGRYEDFLEKVGWEEEKQAVKEKPQSTEKNERRKRHEERMAERARLKVVDLELSKVEKAIDSLEKIQNEENTQLVWASEGSDPAKIQTLLISIAKREKELELLYAKFLSLGEELKNIKNRMQE